jgi:hypothetical protein
LECGFLFLDRNRFAASFAADVPEKLSAFIADSQVRWGVDALERTVCEPAWQTKPSWYLPDLHIHTLGGNLVASQDAAYLRALAVRDATGWELSSCRALIGAEPPREALRKQQDHALVACLRTDYKRTV